MKHLFPAALLLRLDNLLDDLGLLYQERSKDPRIWTENMVVIATQLGHTSSSHSLHTSNHRRLSVQSSSSLRW